MSRPTLLKTPPITEKSTFETMQGEWNHFVGFVELWEQIKSIKQINRYFVVKEIIMNSVAEIKSGLHHYIAETDDVRTLTKLQKYVDELLTQEDTIIILAQSHFLARQERGEKGLWENLLELTLAQCHS